MSKIENSIWQPLLTILEIFFVKLHKNASRAPITVLRSTFKKLKLEIQCGSYFRINFKFSVKFASELKIQKIKNKIKVKKEIKEMDSLRVHAALVLGYAERKKRVYVLRTMVINVIQQGLMHGKLNKTFPFLIDNKVAVIVMFHFVLLNSKSIRNKSFAYINDNVMMQCIM